MADTTVALDNYRGTGSPGSKGWLTPLKANVDIKRGSLVEMTGGYGDHGGDDASVDFAGVAAADLLGGATDGATTGRVIRRGIFAFAMTGGSVAADNGKKAYMVDDQTIGLVGDTTNDIQCGVIIGWDTVDGKWVSGALCLVDIALR